MRGRLDSGLRAFWRDQQGSTLVELAIVLPLVFLLIFGIVDYGRLFWVVSSSNKATEIAARIAVVRPPICAGVPEQHEPTGNLNPDDNNAFRFGTLCRANGTPCVTVNVMCSLDVAAPGTGDPAGQRRFNTSEEIWNRIEPLMPPGAGKDNLRITYASHPDLGFLGGPFTPEITVEIVEQQDDPLFEFVMPLGPMAELASNNTSYSSTWSRVIAFPSMSTSLPAEDLGNGAGEN